MKSCTIFFISSKFDLSRADLTEIKQAGCGIGWGLCGHNTRATAQRLVSVNNGIEARVDEGNGLVWILSKASLVRALLDVAGDRAHYNVV